MRRREREEKRASRRTPEEIASETAAFELQILHTRKGVLEKRLTHFKEELVRILGHLEVERAIDASKPPRAEGAAPEFEAPSLPEAEVEASRLLEAIDKEVMRIDAMLADLAARERRIRRKGFEDVGSPHHADEFTLHAKPVGRLGKHTQAEYFFTADTPHDAFPVPLPEGHDVKRNPLTGERSLVPVAKKAEK